MSKMKMTNKTQVKKKKLPVWVPASVLTGIIVFFLGTFFRPIIENISESVYGWFSEPDCRVLVDSILLSRTRPAEAAKLKIRFRIFNEDEVDRTIQILGIENGKFGLRGSIETAPIRVLARDVHKDSVIGYSTDLGGIFTYEPALISQEWGVSYQIAGSTDTEWVHISPVQIEKLMFFLTPTDSFKFATSSGLSVTEFHQSAPVSSWTPSGRIHNETKDHTILLYPMEKIRVGIDTSDDHIADYYVTGPCEPGLVHEGPVSSIDINAEYYGERVCGFVMGVYYSFTQEDSLWYHVLGDESLSRSFDLFRTYVDRDVLFSDEFIYVDMNTSK
ncbi:MAG: hypothetical protein ABII79_02515 [bacterium]